jgi:signal transduction histidine kinase
MSQKPVHPEPPPAVQPAEKGPASPELRRMEEENRQLRAQLHQARKMEAIGQLAGGLAHDINNLLCAISGYAGLIKFKTSDPDVLKYAGQINSAAGNATNLTRQLLTFAHQEITGSHKGEKP